MTQLYSRRIVVPDVRCSRQSWLQRWVRNEHAWLNLTQQARGVEQCRQAGAHVDRGDSPPLHVEINASEQRPHKLSDDYWLSQVPSISQRLKGDMPVGGLWHDLLFELREGAPRLR